VDSGDPAGWDASREDLRPHLGERFFAVSVGPESGARGKERDGTAVSSSKNGLKTVSGFPASGGAAQHLDGRP